MHERLICREHSPDVENVTRLGDDLIYGFTEAFVAVRVVEHVEVQRRGEERLLEVPRFCCSTVVLFFDDDPFGVTGERVELQLEDALSRAGAHGDGGSEARVGGQKEASEALPD